MSLATIALHLRYLKAISQTNTALLWVMLVLCPAALWGQQWSESPLQYTVDDGLPTLDAYHIQQDREGFLWIGTDVGLARFDGYDFEWMTMRDGLPNNDVIRIQEDRQGRIWLNSIGPLCIIEDGDLRIVDLPSLQRYKKGFDIIESAEGGFWLNYGPNIHYIGPDLQLRSVAPQLKYPVCYNTQAITQIANDTVLIYNGTKLYFTYNDQLVDSLALPSSLRNKADLSYAYTQDGLYFVNRQGLQYWSFQDDSISSLDTTIDIGQKLKIEGQQLFLIHSNYGLRIYQLDKQKTTLSQHLYPSAFCNAYLVDYEGNIWITSLGKGIFFYPRQTVESNLITLHKEHQRINKLLIDDDQLLLGTYNGRIYTYNSATRATTLRAESSVQRNDIFDRIMGLVHLDDGTVLVGKDTGLYELTNDSLRFLVKLAIKAVHVDHQGKILINTQRGCYKVNREELFEWVDLPTNQRRELLKNAFKVTTSRGYSAYTTSDGTTWVDNTDEGLTSSLGNMTTYWKERSNIFGVHINDMVELPDSTLALATHGEGLILLKNGDFWILNEVEQIPSSIVNALYVTGDQLWVATNRGVALLEDIDLARRQFHINVYNRNDGLITEDIADLLVWKDQLMLGTQMGLITMPLDQQPYQEAKPRIIFRGVHASGRELAPASNEKLAFDQNSLQFQFLGLSFRSKGKIRYRYRLAGYDRDWASTTNREINYHNLSPGEYTFEVNAIDYKGQMSEEPASISFSITPHFTQRAGFWVLVVLLAIGLLIGGVHSYLSIRERNVLSILVDEKTAILDQRVQELARSNEELEQFARAASHDLKSPLRNVASFVQLLDRRAKDRLQSEEREYIDLAIQGVKGMERTIDDLLKITRIDQQNEERQLLNFTNIIADIEQANQHLIVEEEATILIESPFPDLLFSKVNAYQLLQNLIINGITYRSESAPVIRLTSKDKGDHWLFSVSDNGIGIALEFQKQIFNLFHRLHHSIEIPGTGIGLTICKKIVEHNGGTISLKSEIGKGTTFFFTVPKQ